MHDKPYLCFLLSAITKYSYDYYYVQKILVIKQFPKLLLKYSVESDSYHFMAKARTGALKCQALFNDHTEYFYNAPGANPSSITPFLNKDLQNYIETVSTGLCDLLTPLFAWFGIILQSLLPFTIH